MYSARAVRRSCSLLQLHDQRSTALEPYVDPVAGESHGRPGVGAGRPFTWGISEALGVTLGGVPLYVPVLVPVLYI